MGYKKQRIMLITDWYPPAYKAGGPVQSIYRIAQLLKTSFDVYVLTSNQDLGHRQVLETESCEYWKVMDDVKVYYTKPQRFKTLYLKKLVDEINPSTIYINGLYSKYFTPLILWLLVRNQIPKQIIAVRGMLKPSALQSNNLKKRFYIQLLKVLEISRKVHFHTTDEEESFDTQQVFGKGIGFSCISNIPFYCESIITQPKSKPLKLLYAARIHPIKNVHMVLDVVEQIKTPIDLTLVGVIDDEAYWGRCENQMEKLLKHSGSRYVGSMPHYELMEEFTKHDVYILPTKGENFGHSIFEAFSAGLPVIISDQTPWRGLEEKQAGFDISLNQPERFVEALEHFCQLDANEFAVWQQGARAFGQDFIQKQDFKKHYSGLFKVYQQVGLVAPITFKRYKGGISVFAEHYLKQNKELSKDAIELHFLNTCIIPRSNSSTGKLRWVNIKNYILFLIRSLKIIRKSKIKVLHYNTSVGLSLVKDVFTAYVFKILTGVKSIIHIHFTDLEELNSKGWRRGLLVRLLKKAHRIVVLSDKLKKRLIDLGVDELDISVIRNYPMIQLDELPELPRFTRNILFIGSVDQRKGILDLLEALTKLKNKANFTVDIAGDFTSEQFETMFKKELQQSGFDKQIKLHGYVQENEKVTLLKRASILVLPSYSEGMPLSILEGLASGCAIVATKVGANEETIGGITDLLNPGDTSALAKELEKLLNNNQYLEQRQTQALELSSQYSFKSFLEQIVPLYQ